MKRGRVVDHGHIREISAVGGPPRCTVARSLGEAARSSARAWRHHDVGDWPVVLKVESGLDPGDLVAVGRQLGVASPPKKAEIARLQRLVCHGTGLSLSYDSDTGPNLGRAERHTPDGDRFRLSNYTERTIGLAT